jgi:hypothetical protein
MTRLYDQDVKEEKSIINFHYDCEFDGRSKAFELKKFLQSCSSIWPNRENAIEVFEPFSGFVVCCIQCYFLNVFHKYVTDYRR